MPDIVAAGRVQKLIVEPMRDRWQQPTGVNIDAIIGDYIADLGRFPEHILDEAFTAVRRNYRYKTWPQASEFFKAALEIQKEAAPVFSKADDGKYERGMRIAKRQREIWEAIKTGPYGGEIFRLGIFVEARNFVFEHVGMMMRADQDPEISNEEIAGRIPSWVELVEARKACWEAVKAPNKRVETKFKRLSEAVPVPGGPGSQAAEKAIQEAETPPVHQESADAT